MTSGRSANGWAFRNKVPRRRAEPDTSCRRGEWFPRVYDPVHVPLRPAPQCGSGHRVEGDGPEPRTRECSGNIGPRDSASLVRCSDER
jgi:hypothetical protein